MKSLGETLSAAREEKGYSLDYVARETNIARKYLAALEAEDFSQFSAGAYETGFLRNYGEYLGLDTKELLDMYHVLKIQEQPLPPELLKRPVKPGVIVGVIVAVLVLGGGGVGAYLLITKPAAVEQPAAVSRVPVTMTLGRVSAENGGASDEEEEPVSSVIEQRFYPDDTIIVPIKETSYKLTLASIADTVVLTVPGGKEFLDLGQEKLVDLDGDASNDLAVLLEDFTRGNSDVGALLRLELRGEAAIAAGTGTTSAGGPGGQPASEAAGGTPVSAAASPVTVFNAGTPYPFTLQITFQQYCMFRYEILRESNRQGRVEEYYSRGQEISLTAQNGVRLWMSNAGAVKTQVIGGSQTTNLTFGAGGEVVVSDLQWVKQDSGRYHLVLRQLEM